MVILAITNLSKGYKYSKESIVKNLFFAFFIAIFLTGCSFSGGGDSTPAAAATTPPVVLPVAITSQPQSVNPRVGDTVSFTIVAENVESYQWQWSSDGTNWNTPPVPKGNSPTYTVVCDAGVNGYFIHCVVSNSVNAVISNSVQITMQSTVPVVTQQPQDQYTIAGESAYMLIYSTNTTDYQWEYAPSVNGPWSRNPGNRFALTQQSFNFVTRAMDNNMVFRCIVTNSATRETAVSNIAHIYCIAAMPQ